MKTNNWMGNHIVRLAAGNLAVVILLIGLPAVVVLHTVGAWSTELAQLAALTGIHVLVLSSQVAMTGTPIPRKWNAAVFIMLPVLDAATTVSYIQAGEAGWSAAALLLTIFAVYVTVLMAREWRTPRQESVTVPVARIATPVRHEFARSADEELMF